MCLRVSAPHSLFSETVMQNSFFNVRLELADDEPFIEQLVADVFGPGMKARAAYALREGVSPVPQLSFVAEEQGALIGCCRLTRITIGGKSALMLGPLAVRQEYANRGIGKALMREAIEAARKQFAQGDIPEDLIMLVGDFAYYEMFGFERAKPGQIQLPRPVDPQRVLLCELRSGAGKEISGPAERRLPSNKPIQSP